MVELTEVTVLSRRVNSLVNKCVRSCHYEHGICIDCCGYRRDHVWWDSADEHSRRQVNQMIDRQIRNQLSNAQAKIALRKLADVV